MNRKYGNTIDRPLFDPFSFTMAMVGSYERLWVARLRFIWSTTTVTSGATNIAVTYLLGLDLIAQNRSNTVRYYGYDGSGNARFLTSAGATVTDTYAYDAFGLQLSSTESTMNEFRYTGERLIPETGLYLLRARYLNPEKGRFWTPDTFVGKRNRPLSLHKYVYAENDPVNRIDPSGNDTFSLSGRLVVGAIIAIVATATYQAYIVNKVGPSGLPTLGRPRTIGRFQYEPEPQPPPQPRPPSIIDVAPIPTGTEDPTDERFLFYHYSQSPPASFANGLFPPAYVTDVAGLDSQAAMFKLGINPPLYEYSFLIGLDKLGPANNSTPGRLTQYPVIKPTGAGSMVSFRNVVQTHGGR
jgi:RHS repeat-associated protein